MALVPEEDILPVLEQQLVNDVAWWRTFPESEAHTVHAPYTWELRQVIQHLADAERVFGFRLVCFARGDQNAMPGFSEDDFATQSLELSATLADTITEFECLRRANLIAIRSLPEAAWDRAGTASGARVTVRALAYILAGHVRHHDKPLKQRMGG